MRTMIKRDSEYSVYPDVGPTHRPILIVQNTRIILHARHLNTRPTFLYYFTCLQCFNKNTVLRIPEVIAKKHLNNYYLFQRGDQHCKNWNIYNGSRPITYRYSNEVGRTK